VLTRSRATRLIAAVQAVTTVLVVLAAAHHRGEDDHRETGGDGVEVGYECASHVTGPTLSSRPAVGVETGECLLCLAAHAPIIAIASPELVTPALAAVAAVIAPIADPPPRLVAVWRTAPKTSPPV